jgi:hypothetical protein
LTCEHEMDPSKLAIASVAIITHPNESTGGSRRRRRHGLGDMGCLQGRLVSCPCFGSLRACTIIDL